jgi:hypothetical protein
MQFYLISYQAKPDAVFAYWLSILLFQGVVFPHALKQNKTEIKGRNIPSSFTFSCSVDALQFFEENKS